MLKQKRKLCRYKSHSTQKKTHERQSIPVVVPIQIETNPSINIREANRKITNMELTLDLELYCKRHAESEHNRKLERVDIEEERQELHHQAQLISKEKENTTSLGGLLEDIRKAVHKSAAHMICSNTALATLVSENKVRIAAPLIRRNNELAKLSSENKVFTSLCLTTYTYYLHSHNTRLQSK